MNRLVALLMLLLSVAPFTAPFSTMSGPALSVAARAVVGVPDDAGTTLPHDENAAAFCVPSLPDGARIHLSDPWGGVSGCSAVIAAAGLSAQGAPAVAHFRAGPVVLSSPAASSIAVLRI